MKQRYINVNHELIPVTEEVYKAFTRPNEKERFFARRDGKCGQSNYKLCSGDCASCPWQQEGHRFISMHKAFGPELERETPDINNASPSFDDVVADRFLLEELYRQLDELIPDGARVFQLRAENYTEREIAQELGSPRAARAGDGIAGQNPYERRNGCGVARSG